jgi:hypothetical protein
VRPSPLEEPGILLRMIGPELPEQPAPRRQPAVAGGSAPARPVAAGAAVRALAGAIASGAGIAAFVLAARRADADVLPFGADGALGWSGCAAVGAIAAALAHRASRGERGRAAAAAVAALAIAAAAVLQGLGGALATAAWPLAATALAAAAALALAATRRVSPVLAATAAAALGPAAVLASGVRLGDAALLPIALGTALVALLAAPATVPSPPRNAAAAGTGRMLLRAAAWSALALALAATPLRGAIDVPLQAAGVAAFAGAVVALAAPHLVLAAACTAVAAAVSFTGARTSGLASPARVVDANGAIEVRYVPAAHELQLVAGGRCVDAVGPERAGAALAVTLVEALARPGDRVLVLGAGGGRIAVDLDAVARHPVDVVDWRPDAATLRPLLLGDGPLLVARATPPLPAAWRHAGPTAALAALRDGARQATVLGEVLGEPALATERVQRELRRVTGGGIVLHRLALDRSPPAVVDALFTSAAAVHAWNGLFVVGDDAVLVSAAAPRTVPHAPSPACSDDARWRAHEARLGDGDIARALLGTLRARPPANVAARDPAAPGGHRAAVLDVVRAWLEPAPPPPPPPPEGSVLERWRALAAELRAAAARVRECRDDAAGRAAAAAIAARFLHVGAPAPELQAALGLPIEDGVTLVAPAVAARRAHALAPEFFAASPPAVCASLPLPKERTSPLEDVAVLPDRARLAELAAGGDPFAVALRARFPSRCARALVEALAAGPLPPEAAQALRELADPFVLGAAAAVLAPRGRLVELLALWRGDLPAPVALAQLAAGRDDDRRSLAAALRARSEPSCLCVLATLLDDELLEVRTLAGEALAQLLPARVAYDPAAPRSTHREAAERVRALHNRTP